MRTTVTLDDELLASAKARARETGQTLGALLEAALRRELVRQRGAERPHVPVFRGGSGARPGLDLTSNAAMQEALDEGLPLEKLR